MTMPPTGIYRLNAMHIKLPMAFFTELEQKFFHLFENSKNLKATLRKENGAGGISSLTSDYTTSLQ